jgi:serine/threonine protein kinase
MPICELGSLDSLILQFVQRGAKLLDEGFLWKVFWDLSLAVCYLWSGHPYENTRQRAFESKRVPKSINGKWNPVIHRDIKPGNVFMTWDRGNSLDQGMTYPRILLGDFGTSVSYNDLAIHDPDFIGGADSRFEAPGPRFGKGVDVYGVGLVLQCLATMSQTPIPSKTQRMQYPLGPTFQASDELVDRVRHILDLDFSRRPNPRELPVHAATGFKAWWAGRNDSEQPLPGWAFSQVESCTS